MASRPTKGLLLVTSACALVGCKDALEVLQGNLLEIHPRFERVDVATGDRTALALPPVLRGGAIDVVVGDELYRLGGLDEGTVFSDALEVYDPATGAWTALAPWPSPRGASTAVVGRRICLGHASVLEPNSTVVTEVERIDCYDVDTGAWSMLPSSPVGTFSTALAVAGDRLFHAGPQHAPAGGALPAAAAVYDFTAEAWESLPDLPAACGVDDAVGDTDAVYVLCGDNDVSRVYALELASSTWSSRADLPFGVFQSRRTFAVAGGLLAGFDSHLDGSVAQRYSPGSDAWSPTPPAHPGGGAVSAFRPAVLGDAVFFHPDEEKEGSTYVFLDEVWRYDLTASTWAVASSHPAELDLRMVPVVLAGELYLIGGIERLRGF
ncbi:MAG: hypothetical protein IT373_31375 [Polyangiaceae bacterium]|nr:hypothetical protein [Polyangiaceae bacterium]